MSDLSIHSLTGYQSWGVWIVEKLSHLIIVLFVFYLLSAFLPGEAGKGFRGAIATVLNHSLRFGFGVLGGALRLTPPRIATTAGGRG